MALNLFNDQFNLGLYYYYHLINSGLMIVARA